MKTIIILILLTMSSSILNGQTLPQVDIHQYEGSWFVIGYKPSALDKKWIDTEEIYTWDEKKGRYDVVTKYKKGPGGKQKTITQKLLPVSNSGNARWIARIFLFIRADYVVYKIADDYSYVVVGHPKQKYLYIMSRKPQMNQELYDDLVGFSLTLGYKKEEIVKHVQESRI